MSDWNYRWVCPHWEFLHYQEDAARLPFAERSRESASTFLNLLNPLTHNVDVRVEFFDSQGNVDIRFGLEGIISGRAAWKYRVDTGGTELSEATSRSHGHSAGLVPGARVAPALYLGARHRQQYTHHARAWGFATRVRAGNSPFLLWDSKSRSPDVSARRERVRADPGCPARSRCGHRPSAFRSAACGCPRAYPYEPELEDARDERRHKDGTPPDRQG